MSIRTEVIVGATSTPLPLLLDTREVATLLGVSAWRVRELVSDGTLIPVRLGQRGNYRFRRNDIERLVAGETAVGP